MAESKSAKWGAIVLAAGLGTRFGGGKLLAPFRGRPLIAGALNAALESPAFSVVVAIGSDDAQLETTALSLDEYADLRVVKVTDPARGMGSSLAAAAQAAPTDLDGVFVFLGDMPLVPRSIPVALAAALTGPDGIVAPVHAGRRGHPVLFGGGWIPALRSLHGDSGAQALIRQAGDRFIAIETDDPGVLFDIDLPEDLKRAPRT
ncbi:MULTISPECIES: nucleotidyltransferase family protein [unclassified Caulobacter]|uniref:nucleotidyltransferase family protein n=1 Tax=unclassified Caulobacter TaxID=2648921 RepID=UPI000D3BF9F8|nr:MULTISPECIES: nucleotidyltransferase family protein [unclassified Caulobacter]PTS87744.1 molybdopterin-guanine dinucleotide biosynthesis protein A [Caulobacter sp. HMWF009]PTT12535.1 molybdopterin-guanine dinucleotide biosynthesis protein A [Caulobacter sp. HMWF025]PTT80148.1 molybdopterin-guanine dinucleotide biosynthesis protein A [Pseudomonas sp. HMWF010]